MLKIRLQRHGKKHKPFYKIILINSFKKEKGTPLAILGNYNIFTKTLIIEKTKLYDFILKGAHLSKTLYKLLLKHF